MRRLLLLLLLFTGGFATQQVNAQNTQRIKEVLDDYCDKYFEDCYGWTYIKIVSIDEVTRISEEEVRVEGVVRNTGYFGSVHDRDFIVHLSQVSTNRAKVKFSKHGNTLGQDYWTDCTRTIDMY